MEEWKQAKLESIPGWREWCGYEELEDCMTEEEAIEITIKICDWKDNHDGEDPDLYGDTKEERQLALALYHFRIAKREYDNANEMLEEKESVGDCRKSIVEVESK